MTRALLDIRFPAVPPSLRLPAATLALAIMASPILGYSAVLKPAGALDCRATPKAASSSASTAFDCTLRLYKNSRTYRFRGNFQGPDLSSGASSQVIWRVLSPTPWVDPRALRGKYETTTKHHFTYAQQRSDVLIGGVKDTAGLQLVAPVIGAIGPGTVLTLRGGTTEWPSPAG